MIVSFWSWDHLFCASPIFRIIFVLSIFEEAPLPTWEIILDGNAQTEYVRIVDKSTKTIIINQLIWTRTPAINVFFIKSVGFLKAFLNAFTFHNPQGDNTYPKTHARKINPSAKFARFLTRFRSFRRGASKYINEP